MITQPQNWKRKGAIALLAIVVIGLAAVLAALLTSLQHHHHSDAEFKPLVETAAGFPIPGVTQPAFPDTKSTTPLEVTRGWNVTGTLTAACGTWGEAFRTWIGGSDLGAITGDVVPNQSCSYRAKKNGYDATLLIAIYGDQSPQAVLTIKSDSS